MCKPALPITGVFYRVALCRDYAYRLGLVCLDSNMRPHAHAIRLMFRPNNARPLPLRVVVTQSINVSGTASLLTVHIYVIIVCSVQRGARLILRHVRSMYEMYDIAHLAFPESVRPLASLVRPCVKS